MLLDQRIGPLLATEADVFSSLRQATHKSFCPISTEAVSRENSKQSFSLPPASVGLLIGLLFNSEDGIDMILRNVGLYPNNAMLQHRRLYSS
jgi:hypothetical protein